MDYYGNEQDNEYKDEFYVPKKDKIKISPKKNQKPKEPKEKKSLNLKKYLNKKVFIILGIILIILIIGIVFFVYPKDSNTTKELENIIINNNEYSPNFSKDIYDYYVLTEDDKLTINCDISKKIKTEGCNETIDISNYSNYIHEIVINDDYEKIYKIYIKVKESDTEKNIVIKSIDGIDTNWSNQNQTISINTECENNITSYSIDNGLTWQESSTFEISENTNLQIIAKDEYGNQSLVRQVSITNIDKTLPTGIIVKEKSNSNEITLKVIAKDEESNIDSYSWSNGSTKESITIKEKGLYYVTVKDKAGNTSEKISIEIKDSDFNNKEQFYAVFYKNGSATISNSFLSCTKNNGKCTITLPTITREDSTIIGWSTSREATTPEYKVGEKLELTKNLALYAITRKDIKATFNKNGADKIANTSESCTLYNDDKYCYVTAPNIIHNSGKITGWNTLETAMSVLESPKSHIKLFDNTTYYALVYKEVIITFNQNGSSKISSTKETCRIQSGNTCFITTPTITREDSEIIGWSTNKNATDADILATEDIEVSQNMTLYAITKKNITITFNSNGSDSISSTKETCSIYNEKESCSITTPIITRSNASIIGWSKDKSSKTATYQENEKLTVKKSSILYAITSKTVTATFKANGSTISYTQQTCTYHNADNGCNVTTPDITRNSWNILGWNTSQNATTATVKENTKTAIKENTTLYAITYRTVTATLYKNNADSLGNCTTTTSTGCKETCNIYNTNDSCSITLPYIYSKGNEVIFFSSSSDPTTTSGLTPAKKVTLKSDITLNAIVDNRHRKSTYNIVKTKNYGYTAFETESGCPSSVYNNYYTFVDSLYKKAPYFFTAAKVTFSTSNSFKEAWNGSYAGMTYGLAIGYRNVDVKCPTSYSDYYLQTIVHELTHAWDSHFQAKLDYKLSSTTEFINLFNKYKNASKQPLRAYAYTDIAEFVADAYSWYYFLYIDTTYQPNVIKGNTYFPTDLKNAVEKYIKIAKNGYV